MERTDATTRTRSEGAARNQRSAAVVRARDLFQRLRRGMAAMDPLLFPPICPLCDADVHERAQLDSCAAKPWWSPFCRTCVQELRQSDRVMDDACRRCGWPSHWSVQGRAIERTEPVDFRRTCRICSAMESTPAFDEVAAVCRYDGLARDAVILGKFPRNASVITAMGHAIVDRLRRQQAHQGSAAGTEKHGDGPETQGHAVECHFDFVLTVPSHVFRQVPRGGSNAAILGHAVAERLGCPYRTPLRLTRRIAKQAWMPDAEARRRNVKGAFRVRRGWTPSRRIPSPLGLGGGDARGMRDNLTALLVDDVMTTGATANEIARVLKSAGIARVSVAVFARALSAQAEPR
ncbi:MAG: phosphoribosyltransferase family protein [Planctomycetota bacterium]